MSQLVARALIATVTNLLPPRQAYVVGAKLSILALREKTKRLREDTAAVFPDKPDAWIDDAVQRQRYTRAWSALDKVLLPKMTESEILACCTPESLESAFQILDEVRDEGRGAIVYTLHYGRPSFSPFVLASRYPYVGIRAGAGFDTTNRPLERRLEELGVELIDAGNVTGGVHAMRALKKNKFLFVLVDGRITQETTFVEFLGKRLPVSLGFVKLAERTGAALVAGVTHSEGPLSFRINTTRVSLPSEDETIEEKGRVLLEPLEAAVREDIGQWYGINRLFRQARRAGMM